jgi:hypothetical protein
VAMGVASSTIARLVGRVLDAGTGNAEVWVRVNGVPVYGPVTADSTGFDLAPGSAVPDDGQVDFAITATTGDVPGLFLQAELLPTELGSIPGMSGPFTASDFTGTPDTLIMFDGDGLPVEVTLDASKFAVVDGEIRLVAAGSSEYATLDTKATTSGTNVVFTIPSGYSDLVFAFEGVSHDSGSSQNLTIELSNDGGTSWTTAATLNASAFAAGNTVYGQVHILDYTSAGSSWWARLDAHSSALSGSTSGTNGRSGSFRADTDINRVRIAVAAGNLDAGQIVLKAR